MANFKVSVGKTRAGNFQVRYRNGVRLPNGRLKQFTKWCIGKNESGVIKGKYLVGEKLADEYARTLLQTNHQDNLGELDLSLAVEDLIESFLEERETNRLDQDTLNHNRSSLNAFLVETEVRQLLDLTSDRIKKWKLFMTQEGFQNSTIRGRLTDLRTFLNWLVESGKLKVSPFGKKMMPQKIDADPKYYSASEFMVLDKAFYEIDAEATRILCHLAHSAGLRKDEALNVRWDDIRWFDGGAELLIRKEVAKGKKKARTVPLDPGIIELLGSRKSGYLVKATLGQVDHNFDRARKFAGLTVSRKTKEGVKYLFDIHGLRHTFAKNYLQRGEGNLASLSKLLGHSSIMSTMIYAQFEKAYLREGINRAYEKRLIEEKLAGQNDIHKLEEVGS